MWCWHKNFFTSNLFQDFFQLKNAHSVKATSVCLSKNNLYLKAIQQKKKKKASDHFQMQSLKKVKGKEPACFLKLCISAVFFFLYLILPWYHLGFLDSTSNRFSFCALLYRVLLLFKKSWLGSSNSLFLNLIFLDSFTMWSQIRNYWAISNRPSKIIYRPSRFRSVRKLSKWSSFFSSFVWFFFPTI